tara:strand:+ start:114 stop:314 length:201 start_codon:yes stop_codon:yes gene_type:complete
MSGTVMLSLRTSTDLVDRMEALIEYVETLDEAQIVAGTVSRSHVHRLALLRGLELLEREEKKAGKK